MKEREVNRELYRVEQPIANNEQAIAYRAQKVKRERIKNSGKQSKDEESKVNESAMSLEPYVLPLEKIYIAQENRKLFAFCVQGNDKVTKIIFSLLKLNNQSTVLYRALLDCFTYAD